MHLSTLSKKIYRSIFRDYQWELGHQIKDCRSILDLACGYPSPLAPFLQNKYSEAVDLHAPATQKSQAAEIHNKYHQINVLDIGKHFPDKSFDCVVALDLIEHLPKEDGKKLINLMENIAKKKIIIVTPNGFLPQKSYDNNELQEHVSGWTVAEMRQAGFQIIGINGYKNLRGELAKLKYKPEWFWMRISDISQLVTRRWPNKAFELLCVKTQKR